MECAGIRELLSEYIDGTLDAQARAAVEKHISICERCKEELASLSAMVEELGSLEEVKAPADFLEKIHERMEPRFGFDWIVRKLFLPIRIKIPLELAAVATITILVFFVFNIQQAEKKMVHIPKVITSERFAEKLKEDRMKLALKKEAKSSSPALEEAPTKRLDSEHAMFAQESKVKTVKPSIEMESEPSASFLAKARVRKPVRKVEPIKLALVPKTDLAGSPYEPGVTMKAAPLVESDKRTDEDERTDIGSFGRKIEARQRGPVADLFSRIKHLIRLVEGKVLTVEYDRQTEQLKTIHMEIPAKSYESFCRELNRLATFQTPPPTLADKDLGTIRIQIRFISSE